MNPTQHFWLSQLFIFPAPSSQKKLPLCPLSGGRTRRISALSWLLYPFSPREMMNVVGVVESGVKVILGMRIGSEIENCKRTTGKGGNYPFHYFSILNALSGLGQGSMSKLFRCKVECLRRHSRRPEVFKKTI